MPRNLQEPPGTSRSLPKLFRLKPYQMGSRFWGQKIDIFNIFCCEVYNSPALQRFPTKRSTYPKRKSGSRVITSSWAMGRLWGGWWQRSDGFQKPWALLVLQVGEARVIDGAKPWLDGSLKIPNKNRSIWAGSIHPNLVTWWWTPGLSYWEWDERAHFGRHFWTTDECLVSIATNSWLLMEENDERNSV